MITLDLGRGREVICLHSVRGEALRADADGERAEVVEHHAATPTERTLLEPGNYIVGITFADCDAETLQQWSLHEQWDAKTRYQMMEQHIEFPLYLKAGYIRSTATDTFERCAASIGLKVRGRLCR